MTGPLEGIYDFINGLEENLRNEQMTADQLFMTESARCEEELGKRENNIKTAKKAFSYEQARNAQCSTTYNNAEEALINAKDASDTLASDKRLTEEQRLREQNSYAKNKLDNQRMLDGIDKALYYLAQMYSVKWEVDQLQQPTDYLINVDENGNIFIAAAYELPIFVMEEPEVMPLETDPAEFVQVMRGHAVSLIKIATSQDLLSKTAPVIRGLADFLRIKQE